MKKAICSVDGHETTPCEHGHCPECCSPACTHERFGSDPTISHVVMFSGGAGSWATAKRVADLYGTRNLHMLFADTKMEDEDLYRFVEEASANVGGTLHKISEGRDVWEIFFDERYLGNTRIDPCSKILKRQLMRKWLEDNFQPETTVVYLGFDWDERHRFDRAAGYWTPWVCKAPMLDEPHLDKAEILALMEAEGIEPPRLYKMGFQHNNCGGFCVKAGQKQFQHLLETMPERYAYHESKEQELRTFLGKDVSILRDRRGGTVKPLTMKAFRERLQEGAEVDPNDWGGCACMEPGDGEAA